MDGVRQADDDTRGGSGLSDRPIHVTYRPPADRARRFFVACAEVSDEAAVPVVEAVHNLFVPVPFADLRKRWPGISDLLLVVTVQDERYLVGEADWEGTLVHGDLWAGFTDEELHTLNEGWMDLVLARHAFAPLRERARHPGG